MSEKPANTEWKNLGTRRIVPVRMSDFPNVDGIVQQGLLGSRPKEAVDILLVNPPTPDGALWIRTQHRVGRRTRENMVWPQVSLAQMAALLHPAYTLKIVDANAERMGWKEFTALLDRYFTAINARDYAAYAGLLDRQRRRHETAASFRSGYGSTTDSDETLTAISDTGSGDLAASVTFTSHQKPADSLEHSSCTRWAITLYLVRHGTGYLIETPPAGYRAYYQAC